MNVIKLMQLFLLTWSFAVCQADDECRVSCDDVTGSVGIDITLSCRVSQECTEYCIKKYKFLENGQTLDNCVQEVSTCERKNTFTCRYTPAGAMKKQTHPFKFFLQTTRAMKTAEFSVNITESSKQRTPETAKAPEKKDHFVFPEESPGSDTSDDFQFDKSEGKQSRGFKIAVIAAVVSCFIIVIVPLIYKMKEKQAEKKFQRRSYHCDPPEKTTEQQFVSL